MAGSDMPIFTRTFDFLSWLLPMTNNFPRAHRHSATKRLLDAAFDLRRAVAGVLAVPAAVISPPPPDSTGATTL